MTNVSCVLKWNLFDYSRPCILILFWCPSVCARRGSKEWLYWFPLKSNPNSSVFLLCVRDFFTHSHSHTSVLPSWTQIVIDRNGTLLTINTHTTLAAHSFIVVVVYIEPVKNRAYLSRRREEWFSVLRLGLGQIAIGLYRVLVRDHRNFLM